MFRLRSALFACCYAALTAMLSVAATVLARTGRQVLRFGQVWARAQLAAARLVCGIRLEVRGADHVPEGPVIIASQHQSAYDIPVLMALLPRAVFVFKIELMRIPLFGRLIVKSGMIPVDRAGGAGALRAMVRQAVRAATEGRQLVIFPEGTRVAPGATVRLHPGVAAVAAATGLPVVPVRTDSGAVWPARGFPRRAGTVRVAFLPALPAGLPRAELLRRLQDAFEAVENPVGTARGELRIEASLAPEPVDKT